ncbi:MAG: M24 family metallopeptidase C-terminal domain-containing protein, partial [Acetobacteraceae bacterium]
LVRPAASEAGGKSSAGSFLCFETLTLAPFARTLIQCELLTPAQLAWLNAYNARVRNDIGPTLKPSDRAWLETEAAPLG